MTTPILSIEELANAANNYLLANEAFRKLENATNERLIVDLSSGDVVLSTAQINSAFLFVGSGHSVTRSLTAPLRKRLFAVRNAGTGVINVVRGSSSEALAIEDIGFFYTDGTADGLFLISKSAGTGNSVTESFIVACSNETTPIVTGVAKATIRIPYAFTLLAVRASLTTPQASGSIVTVDINENGSSILSTKITIDNTEKSSATASTAPVISDVNLAEDAEITFDIDQVGDGTATGLKVTLIGYQP